MKLEKFTKNKKEKKIIIGIIIGLVLLVGGITLYRTFALYEEKKEFDVLKGVVPDFIYKEEILNGADPVLKGNLIPVEIDNTGKVTKANIKDEWYNYEKKIWANAVILSDKTKAYKDYEEIPESNIESYFVWIPKYSYQLWDLGEYKGLTEIDETKPHVIPIKFGLNNTSDSKNGECTTPGWNEETKVYDSTNVSGASGNCQIEDYMTHPAFLSMGTNGLWVGKFETGYKEATTTTEAEYNENNSSKVQIKPNVYSWRNIQPANAHLTSYNYQRELDSHMMKNTEWGAVAYLQHSKYGSATSVRINNNSAYITGYAAVSEPTTVYNAYNDYESTSLGADGTKTINYKNPASKVASTTGNYSGIYDMSGGVQELMMGVMLDSTNISPMGGFDNTESSGFNGKYTIGGNKTDGIDFPNSRYYDTYKYNTSQTKFKNRILGDAMGEMGPFSTNFSSSWYFNRGMFLFSTGPWFIRGESFRYGNEAGVFAFYPHDGGASTTRGFRIVLAI